MTACEVDWSLWPDWISAIASVLTLFVAVWAAASWRQQLRGGSKHSVAQDVAAAARSLRYAFYGARSPMVEGWEFPRSYWERGPGHVRTNSEQAAAFQHVYHRRMQELWTSIRVTADLRARAGAILSEEVAQDLENIAKKARELQFFFDQRVEQLRVGSEGVARWTDQNFVERVKESVVAHDPPDDKYSEEFEKLLGALLSRVTPNL